jgi:hypothetical protein
VEWYNRRFITHWTYQVRLYERQVSPSDLFSDCQKRIMLENAVSDLLHVKNHADLQQTRTGSPFTYDEYLSLLLSAVTAYDNQFAAKKQSARCSVIKIMMKTKMRLKRNMVSMNLSVYCWLMLLIGTTRSVCSTTTGWHICQKRSGIALITRTMKYGINMMIKQRQ